MKRSLNFIAFALLINAAVAQSAYSKRMLEKEQAIWSCTSSDSTLYLKLYDKFLEQKSAGYYADGLKTLDRLIDNDSILYQKSLLCYLMKDYSTSDLYMSKIDSSYRRQSDNAETLYLLLKAEAEQYEVCARELSVRLGKRFDSIPLLQAENISVIPAVRRSAWLPGLGLIGIPHQTGRGITSFLLTGSTIALTAVLTVHGYYAFAAVFGAYPFYMFYNGGKRMTYNKIEQINSTRRQELKQEWKNLILQEFASKE